MMEREQLIEFVEGIVTKEQLENVATVEQLEEQNRKLMARLDVQQGQLDGLQARLGAMQVKVTQMQLQVVRMEELLAARAVANETPVRQEPETMKQVEPETPVVEEKIEEQPVIKTADTAVRREEPKEKQETHTIADAIKGEESLADKLSKRVDRETVATSLNSSKIERIQTAITIADRFRFQRELFAGDAVKMAETVETLNKMKSLDEALAYIEKNFSWDMDQQVTMDFIRIVERRF